MKTAFWRILTFLLCLMPFVLQAQTSEEPNSQNFRERCRKIVSGAFADSWNDGNRSKDAEKVAVKALNKLRSVQEKNNTDLKAVQEKISKENYDPSLIRRRDEIVAQIRLYHEQIETQENLQDIAKKENVQAELKHKTLAGAVSKIFVPFFVDDPDGAPRQVFQKLAWKSPCPKYRALCPLPAGDAKVLATISDLILDQDSNCKRYASLK